MTDEKDIVGEAKIRLEKARKVVSNMCSGDGKWLMQIPANPNQDSDIIISNSLNDVDRLIQKVEKLHSELAIAQNLNRFKFRGEQDEALKKEIDSLTKERDHFKMTTEFENKACIRAEDKLKKLEAENAELKKWKSEWEDRYYRLEKSSLSEIASLKAQLSESQERVKVLERLAVKKQWENIKQ